MGEGEGGGDNDCKYQVFSFTFPLTPPLSRKGRGSFPMDTILIKTREKPFLVSI
jgi:hypothetical protein